MFNLPELPYTYDALEPFIDEQTMKIHHDLHHGAYVTKLNAALEGQEKFLNMDIVELLKNIKEVPEDKRQAVINNGGGHANHTMFWDLMTPGGSKTPTGEITEALNAKFESFENFKTEFANAGVGRFGSGWAWLVVNNGDLELISTPNQDSPLMDGKTPVLGLDVWEHAYYLKYQNRRPEYIEQWWNVVNWDKVEELYQASK